MREIRTGLAVALLLACGAVVARAEGEAEIKCDDPDFDFGRMDSRENIVHTFVLRSTGSAPLEITGVDATCGCTVTSFAAQRVMPGQRTEVTITFRLAGRSGPQAKPILVNSNARNRPQLQLVMRGEALSRVTMSPSSILFGRIASGRSAAETAEINTDGSVSFNIHGVKSDSPHFIPSVEVLEPGRRFRVGVALSAAAPQGRLDGEVSLQTDSPAYPTLYLPVSAHVVGELLVTPTEIVLDEGSDPVTKSAFITAGQVTKFRVLEVRSPVDWLQPKVVPFGEDGFRILLRGLRGAPELAGTCLIVTTDAPTMPEIRIPFRVTRPGSASTSPRP